AASQGRSCRVSIEHMGSSAVSERTGQSRRRLSLRRRQGKRKESGRTGTCSCASRPDPRSGRKSIVLVRREREAPEVQVTSLDGPHLAPTLNGLFPESRTNRWLPSRKAGKYALCEATSRELRVGCG